MTWSIRGAQRLEVLQMFMANRARIIARRSDYSVGRGAVSTLRQGRIASALNAVLGAWLVLTPWLFGFVSDHKAESVLIIAAGSAVGVLSTARYLWPREGVALSWSTLFLGGWLMLAPWARGYVADLPLFWSSTVVGAATIVFSVWSICSTALFNASRKRWRTQPGAFWGSR
jgi:hypothetical protein